MRRNVVLPNRDIVRPSAAVSFAISAMSAPATKALLPSPVRITTRMPLLGSILVRHSFNSVMVAMFSAFKDLGLLIFKIAI